MAKKFTHLTLEEREQIRILRLQKLSSSKIAKILGRSKSTICEEVKRHLHHNGYEPLRAHGHARVVRRKPRRPKKMGIAAIELFVKEGLLKHWSPQQIAGRMQLEFPRSSFMHISHQCIYDWLERDKKSGGSWYKLLRINNKKRKRRRVKAPRKVNIANRKGIEERPQSVETRRFYGDWEADTVEGALNRGRIATMVERKTLFTVIAKMETRHAHCFNAAVLERLQQHASLPIRTITADNGAEFARHKELEEQLGTRIYFAEPYCSWQRGLNENTNRLIRQYFPKKTDFKLVSKEEIALIEERLNNRPRKKLAYRTPAEVMANYRARPAVRIAT